MNNRELIFDILNSRPTSNHEIDQVLMTPASVFLQFELCASDIKNKKIIFIGDDDHVSLLFSKFYDAQCTVLEYDQRIIKNLQLWSEKLELKNYQIKEFNAKNPVSEPLLLNNFNFFYINPPYSSKNKGYGAKVWLSRALECCNGGAKGILVVPIMESLDWSMNNINIIENFLLNNNCTILRIDQNVHNYLDASDVNLKSSNILVKYDGSAVNLIGNVNNFEDLYR